MIDTLNSLCRKDGICAAGTCDATQLVPYMSPESRAHAEQLVPHARMVFVVLMPYFCGDTPGNLSLYARGRDYHEVMQEVLAPFAAEVAAAHQCIAVPLADASPLPETQAARLSGVGKIGENGLLFDPTYGSYVFIGTVLTDLPYTPLPAVHRHIPSVPRPPEPPPHIDCAHCGACVRVCPLGAIAPAGRIDPARCLSALTQQGGTLPPAAAEAVAAHPLIWGCDLCQRVCPQNIAVRQTDHPAFRENLLTSLTAADVDGLTRRAFLEKYPHRGFTWRGPAPLKRNLKLKEE